MSVSYPREELWERKISENAIKIGEMTTFFRPGKRVCDLSGDNKCFNVGEEVRVVVVEFPGYSKRSVIMDDNDKSVFAEVLPEFSGVSRRAKIVDLKILGIEEISSEHFEGSPHISTKNELLNALSLTYNKPLNSFDIITRIKVEYLD